MYPLDNIFRTPIFIPLKPLEFVIEFYPILSQSYPMIIP